MSETATLQRLSRAHQVIPIGLSMWAEERGRDLSDYFHARFPHRDIRLRSGVDRYGFSHVLAERVGLTRPPHSFANWLHGWIWWDAENAQDLMFDSRIQHKTHIVATASQQATLQNQGFTNVRAGGLPFCYVPRSDFQRVPSSLLVMPPHSSEADRLKNSQAEYFDYIQSIQHRFALVAVCVFHTDLTPALEQDLRKRGLSYLIGAKPDDANALRRMRAIFDSFEFVSTNTMGSHIAYAIHCGCKTSIAGPLYQYCESDFASLRTAEGERYLARLLHYYSREYIAKEYSFLLVDSPADAQFPVEFDASALGANNLMDSNAIQDALSWSPWGQVRGYAQAVELRVERALFPRGRVGAARCSNS